MPESRTIEVRKPVPINVLKQIQSLCKKYDDDLWNFVWFVRQFFDQFVVEVSDKVLRKTRTNRSDIVTSLIEKIECFFLISK